MKYLVIGIKEHPDAPELAAQILKTIRDSCSDKDAGVMSVEVEEVDLQAGLNTDQLEAIGSGAY